MARKVWHARQGDVLILESSEVKARFSRAVLDVWNAPKPVTSNVVAEGEATGHHHTVTGGQLWVGRWDSTPSMLMAVSPIEVRHEEHGLIPVPAGGYEIRIQREYRPGGSRDTAWRRVMD